MSCRVLPEIIGVSSGLPFVLSKLLGLFRKKHIFIAVSETGAVFIHSVPIVAGETGAFRAKSGK
jgi:hypothetical protein